MKGKSPLFAKIGTKFRFKLNLQLFAIKKVSDLGISIQNNVSNQKLKNLIGELYREGASVGDGSAMAAASFQVNTGELVQGKNHVLKIKERMSNANNIIRTQNLNPSDKKFIERLLKDMEKSLRGKY